MIKNPLTPSELYEKFESYLKAAQVLGGLNYNSCKLSLPHNLFEPFEKHLKSNSKTNEERIGEGYVIAYGDHQLILVKSKINFSDTLDDILIMVPTERNHMAPLEDKSIIIQPNEYGEQTFVAYLPKQGAIGVIASKLSLPNIAVSFFYPNNIEILNSHSYSDLSDIASYVSKQLMREIINK